MGRNGPLRKIRGRRFIIFFFGKGDAHIFMVAK
jgi:hypothetical protein